MANIGAIRSVGGSLATYLDHAYRASVFPQSVIKPACTFSLRPVAALRTDEIAVNDTSVQVVMTLYRASINQHLRNVGRATDPGTRPVPLSVDLRYLFSFWATTADNEQNVLAWTMRQLHMVPVLDGSILSAEAGWTSEDVIQLIPEEISNEDLMRMWDAFEPDYRLSLSYIARIIRIDPDEQVEGQPVVARRFDYSVPSSQP
jgi:hypothetical protein